MDEVIEGEAMTRWLSRLMALRSNPNATYFALNVTDASYISSTGEYISRARVSHGHPGAPEIDRYQYPIDSTPYRIAASSSLLITTYEGGPPVGWQPPKWCLVHEEEPNCFLACIGKADSFAPSPDVLERAREWIAQNATS